MKFKSILVSALSALLFCVGANAQGDYYVKHGADVTVNHKQHYPIMVGVSNVRGEQQTLNNIASAPYCAAYFDKTSTVFEVKSGETVTPLIAINGSWMHGYVYVDWNNNKQFDVNISGDGPYVKEDGNELMCWSLYSHNGNGDSGWNSAGLYQGNGNVLAPGSFRVPEGLEVGSAYRMRYAIQWNSIDPTGSYANYISDGGAIIDVTLKISGIASEDELNVYPINDYAEPRVGTTPDEAAWSAVADGLNATWASRDVHYKLHEVPQVEQKNTATLRAWKGERANIQAVLYSKTDQDTLDVRMTEWKKNGVATGVKAAEARFVNYVITDDFTSCGNNSMGYPTWLVADVIDQDKPHAVPAMETRPVWCTVEVPRNIEAGEYTTTLEVVNKNGDVVKSLALNIVVDTHSLPTVAEQKFHLDFWQQPYAVSRYYGVERWSEEHFDALRPYLAALGRAGQRVVTTILFYEPWGEQTHDLFDPMVQTTKKSNGTWEYDYTVFDKYVELCAEYGIDKQINCFSMLPWDMSFRYFDEASNSYKTLTTTYTSAEYSELWTSFLTAFKAHLIEKGWFNKTNIAVDERGEAAMLKAYEIAHGLGFEMALAGNYHGSLCDILYDKCVQLGQEHYFTAAQLAARKAKNWVTTYYTSCANSEPNIYTNSYPAEAAYLPIYAAKMNLDGYLHWSWMNWDEDPLTDSRYRKFGSGDTYCYYPGNRSSVRFERLIEGIHQYEKIQILREEYKNDEDKLADLQALLDRFTGSIAGTECAARVNDIEDFLNGLEVELPDVENVPSGYYHLVSRDVARYEHLYNDATMNSNSLKITLQSDTKVNTNNGIWLLKAKRNGKFDIKNGDGNPIVAGGAYGSSILGSYTELTVGSSYDAGGYHYYYFTEALNCSNTTANYKVNGIPCLTTWVAGGADKNDNQWRLEPVDMEGKSVYDVVVDGNADVYVTYDGGNAFNGGFFITDSKIEKSQLAVGILGNVIKSADVEIEGNTIKVTNIKTLETPVKQDLYNTSKGDGVIPPYRIPGITTASNGRLITAAARLVCGTDPGYGQVDVVCRVSDDHGKTWSNMIDVAVGTGRTSATVNYFDTAFGDPAIVADRTSDEVLIIAVAGCTVYGNGNTTRQNPNMIATILSKDNGETWEKPINVTEDIYSLFDAGNVVQSAFVGGGKVFQSRIVKKDKYYRLYAAMCARPNGNRVIYSDDFGKTWHALGGASALPAPGGDEPKCEELPDGRVILSSRVGGGRIYNIYTYSNTFTGAGAWSTDVKSTFEGSGLTPGGNSTNGEILIVPVKRNSDGKDMYLALQSLPTGGGRTNVGIFYKELTDFSDLNGVANFAVDWNGFYQVSNTASAYSSMDLQADNRIGFIYEETLTGFGRRDNPVSTSFPNGEGQHNFDGFDNIYVAYDLEYITNGAYSINRDVDRRAFVRGYFNALADDVDMSADDRELLAAALDNLSEQPAPKELDAVYAVFSGVEPADKWDGKVLTFTNVQQNGTERVLYINNSNVLDLSSSTAEALGDVAQFLCKKEESGKYSFFNEAAQLYMIWRAGSNYGYNNNSGTLATYNAAYCDWSINQSSVADRYYLVSKRADGTTDGSLIVMASGVFDAYSAQEGYAANYSNLFRIDVVDIESAIDEVKGDDGVKVIYDLQGRKVEIPVKGIYIINGKKLLLK